MITVSVVDENDSRVQDLVAYHCELATTEAERYRGNITSVGGASVRRVYVAKVDESPIGSLMIRIESDKEWVIEYVHVVSQARGVGTGDHLLRQLIADARAAGVSKLTASALPGDRGTKNLFERFGLIAETIIVSKDLSA